MPGTTPVYGFPYPEPTDLVADYPALGQQLAEDIEAVLPTLGGLSPIIPTSIANTGGTATRTNNRITFSGVSALSIDGCFTSARANYRIVGQLTLGSGNAMNLRWRGRTGGTTNSGATYRDIGAYATNGGTFARIYGNGLTLGTIAYGGNITTGFSCDVIGPQLANPTVLIWSAFESSTNDEWWSSLASNFANNAQFDGINLFPDSGTMSGSVAIYGYNQ